MAVRWALTGRFAACALSWSLVAHAQDNPGPAETLFRQARADMKALRFDEACPRFGESFALAPAPGTLLNWGICEELLGHQTSAWTKLQRFLAEVPADDVRRELAKSHIAVIEKDLAWLKLALAAEAPADASIWLDGEHLDQGQLGIGLPLRPGQHRVELRDAAHAVLGATVVVLEPTQHQAVTMGPPPGPVPDVPATPSEPAQAPVRQPEAEAPRPHQRSESLALRNGAFASGSIALGALTASLVFGGLSLEAKRVVSKHCEQRWCDGTGVQAAQRGSRFVLLADVALVVGGVAALTSVTLFWASKRESIAFALTPGGASLGFLNAF